MKGNQHPIRATGKAIAMLTSSLLDVFEETVMMCKLETTGYKRILHKPLEPTPSGRTCDVDVIQLFIFHGGGNVQGWRRVRDRTFVLFIGTTERHRGACIPSVSEAPRPTPLGETTG